jgi:hypothetical protein
MASPSAVTVIETPTTFVLEARPEIPGELAYSGRWQLLVAMWSLMRIPPLQ